MVNVAYMVRASICGVEGASSSLVFYPFKLVSGCDEMVDMLGLGPSELFVLVGSSPTVRSVCFC